ncbi:MAG: cysteine desulfurase family protein [Planctomycetota bacterium]|jgi:cysteine desulfurase
MIYLDYNASTPIDPAVREAMWPYLGRHYGNPSSDHTTGRRMREAVDNAREQVASMLGAQADEIVFTSGGTEANNFVIKGVAAARCSRGRHIITSAVEHPAIVNPCRSLEGIGVDVSYVGVDSTGRVDPQNVSSEIRPDTILITIMHANNEVGTIQPIAEIAAIAREAGIFMHTDAAQSCAKIDTQVEQLSVDFLSVEGHKVYAPTGIGAGYIRSGIEIEPLHHGAGHERGRRAGTEPVPAIVGLAAAAELAMQHTNDPRIVALRDRLHDGLRRELGEPVVLLGHPERRLPNTLAVGFRGRIGADILAACPKICASTGAACHSGKRAGSATLAAMNVPDDVAFGAIRFSVGRFTTEEEIDEAVTMIVNAVRT